MYHSLCLSLSLSLSGEKYTRCKCTNTIFTSLSKIGQYDLWSLYESMGLQRLDSAAGILYDLMHNLCFSSSEVSLIAIELKKFDRNRTNIVWENFH